MRSRRTRGTRVELRARGILAMATALLAFAAVFGVAHAGKGLDSIIGGTGATGGLFSTPRDVAVHQATGDVFVVDENNHRIQRLSSNGTFERAWGRDVVASGAPGDTGTGFEICTAAADCKAGSFGTTADAPTGEFDNPQGIAINQTTGAVYVRDRDNRRVEQFDLDGNFVRAWGWNVAAAGDAGDTPGGQFEICVTLCQIGATGAGIGQFATASTVIATGIDVSPVDGDVFVVDPSNRRVQRFNSDGTPDASPVIGSAAVYPTLQPRHLAIGTGGVLYTQGAANNIDILRYDFGTGSFDTLGPIGMVAVTGQAAVAESLDLDPVTGRLIVGSNPAGALDTVVYEIAGAQTASPSLFDTHMSKGAGNLTINGIGLDPAQGKIFVSTATGGSRVLVLDADGSSPPVVEISAASDVGAHQATFHGSVTPGGPTSVATSYRFEYSETGREDDWTPVAPLASVGDGNLPVAVDDAVSGLEANTFYRMRVVAEKAFDSGSATSAELTFLTDSVAPEVTTLTTKQRGPSSAVLTGRVNANNLPTTWWFEYGETTEYGSVLPVPAAAASGGVEQAIEQQVAGLEPDTTYHYRLVAANSEGTTAGSDRTFETRTAVEAPSGRAYEMVTPAEKTVRTTARFGAPLHELAATGIPSLDGETMIYALGNGGTADPDGGAGSSHFPDMMMLRRGTSGWRHEAIFTRPSFGDFAAGPLARLVGYSGDLDVQAWRHASTLFESKTFHSTRTFDGGGPDGDGWHEWIDQPTAIDMDDDGQDRALVDDSGARMVRWGDEQATYRGLLGPDDPSRDQLPGGEGGDAIYLATPPSWTAAELVNECTGTGAAATEIPARIDSGAPFPSFADDTIGVQACEPGQTTSKRGATLGAGNEVFATAMSNDGRRMFFTSPDSRAASVPASCAFFTPPADPATGANTDCAPQVYARQYDDGTPTVRWISKSEIAGQSIDLLATALFERASADGRTVFFRTSSPLTEDDPNGTGAAVPGGVTTGSPSSNSWDLYRYRLPASGDPAGGELTRISGGPTGAADPATNRVGDDARPGRTVVRHMSDDGKRVYFVTTSPISGADNDAPAGGATTPAGSVGNATIRNLYLYDEDKAGPGAYKFVAQLPAVSGAFTPNIRECASTAATPDISTGAGPDGPRRTTRACVRGSSSGDAMVLETDAQLTADDTDAAWDIYLYEAGRDELTRVSAPPAGQEPYTCDVNTGNGTTQSCNADLGWGGNDLDRTRRGRSGLSSYNLEQTGAGDFRALYFNTPLALTTADANGRHFDVYRWESGDLSLVSPGNAPHHAWYSGNTYDGEDVFIYTSQPLDPYREIDEADFDVYDVRRGGGFPPPPTPTDPCDVLGDDCHGEGGTRIGQSIRSDQTAGGNAVPGLRAELSVATLSRAARARAARFGVLALRVRSSSAGRVRATATARIGKRSRGVGQASKRLAKAGSTTLRIRLSYLARRQLRSGKALRLNVAVRMPGARPRSIGTALRRQGGR